ncbi:serine-rich adhesin for platelets-like [Haliotis rufescens]|uniref:serine-rich adhesin for platelets-like n=1 Tax=Haliotis rufescens TaxID=6454 RepID=UPI00201EF0CA|nr:serine-rich adhesin for platelets-like [Haliotis rufescens]XP_046356992.2 serine-rich adhesin for platelets-like [Haliotis rufescens]
MADVAEVPNSDGRTRKSKRKAANKALEEPMAANDDKDEDKEMDKPDSPSRSTSSPDPNCAICLSKLENKSFTDSCFHMFCFVCLLEWSKIKAECPLCKQPFKSIIHNVRSYDDYDQYHLEVDAVGNQFSFGSPNGRRFRYRTTLTQDHVFGFRPRRNSQHPDIGSRLPTTITTRQNWRRQREAATSEFRRRVYINGMRVVGIRDSSGRSRNISPEFFASNPATSHRLVPWLNRELNALLYNHEEHVQFVLELIMDLIKRFPIQSEEFFQHVFPFISRHTRHFMHEFESFAKSPFCISSYDQKAIYEQKPESVSDSDSVHSDGNDSDVMIVSPTYCPTSPSYVPNPARRRRDPGAVRLHHPRSEITPYSVSLRDLLEEDDDQITSHSGWESPIAGPSWHLTPDTSSALAIPGSSSSQPGPSYQFLNNIARRKRSKVKVEGAAGINVDSETNLVESDSESGSDVVCTGYDKPWQERTPVVVSTDTEEENMIEKAEKIKRKKAQSKRQEDSKKSRRRSRSPSHSQSRRRRRSRSSSSRSNHRRSRSHSASRHRRRRRSTSSRYRSRSRSGSRHQRYRSPSPSSRSRYKRRNRSRSLVYEDAFGFSRRTARSPETNSVIHSDARRKKKRDRHRNSRYSDSSSRSRSKSSEKYHRSRHNKSKSSRRHRGSRSSSVEVLTSKHKHKKHHKKHKRSRDTDKEKSGSNNVQYKIVKDKCDGKSSKDPLLSITIKRDKSEDTPVVSSTVDAAPVVYPEIDIPENLVIRTEPVSPQRTTEASNETVTQTSEESTSSTQQIPVSTSSTLQSHNQTSSSTLQKPATPKEGSDRKKEDSDSSDDCVEVKRKSFKKHPSGHKKSRRQLPRLPDPSTSTVTSSTCVSQVSDQRIPVLDAMAHLFQGLSNQGLSQTPQSDFRAVIPGMMSNLFDTSLMYGYPAADWSSLSNFLPRLPAQVTSLDHPVMVSSSDDSDVVVESVDNSSRQAVSSSSNSVRDRGLQDLMRVNFMDRIPVLCDEIHSHKSIEVQEEISVVNSDSDTIIEEASSTGRPTASDAVMEVIDSDDEPQDLSTPERTQMTSKKDESKDTDGVSKDLPCETGDTSQPELISAVMPDALHDSQDLHPNHPCSVNASSSTANTSDPDTDKNEMITGDSCASKISDNSIKNSNSSNENISQNPSTSGEESIDVGVEWGHSSDPVPVNNRNGTATDHRSEESMDIDVVGDSDAGMRNDIAFVSSRDAGSDENGSEQPVASEQMHLMSPLVNSGQPNADSTRPMAEACVSNSANQPYPLLASVSNNVTSHLPKNSPQQDNGELSSDSMSSHFVEAESNIEISSAGEGTSARCDYSLDDGEVVSSENGDSQPAPILQMIEGVSEISSDEEEALVQKHPQVIADASDISSEESDFGEVPQPTPSSVSGSSKLNPQVIGDNTDSSDEGEISSDDDVQPQEIEDLSNVSSESDDSSSRHASESYRISQFQSNQARHSSTVVKASSTASMSRGLDETSVRPAVDSRLKNSDNDDSSSGELSDNSDDEQVYDDISSSENFDSPASPNRQVDQPLVTRDLEESLSEGEIVSD